MDIKLINNELNRKNIALIKEYQVSTSIKRNKILSEILKINEPFINKIIKGYSNEIKEDLLQECNIAIYEAIIDFNLDYDNFLTYATYKIQHRINNFRVQNNNMETNYSKRIFAAYSKYPEKNKSITEIAKEIGTTPNTLQSAIESQNPLLYFDKEDFENIIESEQDNVEDFLLKDKIKDVINTLSEKEKIVIVNFFGFGVNPLSKTEIGKLFTPHIKRQYINSLYKKAMSKIKKRLLGEIKD